MRQLRHWCESHPRAVLGIFLLLCAVIGWICHGDFGVSEDEPAMLAYGQDTILYLFHGGTVPSQSDWNFLGPSVQALLAFMNDLWNFKLLRDVWLLRHFLTFLIFLGGLGAFFALAKRLTGSVWWALLGAVWMFLSPRLFAHAFVNPKDIPALTFFTASMLTLVRMLEKPTWTRILLHALLCAVSISLRPFALLLPLLTLLCLAAQEETTTKRVKMMVFYLIATALLTIAVWPRLWHDPLGGLIGALTDNTSRNAATFYMGTLTNNLPWHYVPVWMAITIPPLYTVLFLIGSALTIVHLARHPLSMLREQTLPALAVLWIFVPVLAQIILHIGIFDEWRHLLFIYPGFLLLSLIGALWLWHRFPVKNVRIALAIIGIGSTLWTAGWMTVHRGLQQDYFSVPASLVQGKFEGDYWGMAYKQGLEWVMRNETGAQIRIYGANRTVLDNAQMLSDKDQNRLALTGDPARADFILDTYRWSKYVPVLPESDLVHAITVGGVRVLGIYKGPDTSGRYPVYGWQE